MFSSIFSIVAEGGAEAAEKVAEVAETVVSAGSSVGAGIGVLGVAIGVGIIVFGAALGLCKIVAGMAEGMSRQPEVAGDIRGAAMLLGFLLEGIALFACVIALIAAGKIV